jgi:hypothetical protein
MRKDGNICFVGLKTYFSGWNKLKLFGTPINNPSGAAEVTKVVLNYFIIFQAQHSLFIINIFDTASFAKIKKNSTCAKKFDKNSEQLHLAIVKANWRRESSSCP